MAFVFRASLFNLLICFAALNVELLNKPLTAPENCKYSLVLLCEPEVITDKFSDFEVPARLSPGLFAFFFTTPPAFS